MCDDNCEITIKNGNLTYVLKNTRVEITEDFETAFIENDAGSSIKIPVRKRIIFEGESDNYQLIENEVNHELLGHQLMEGSISINEARELCGMDPLEETIDTSELKFDEKSAIDLYILDKVLISDKLDVKFEHVKNGYFNDCPVKISTLEIPVTTHSNEKSTSETEQTVIKKKSWIWRKLFG